LSIIKPPKYVADVMLGSLSRWLRLFGFDTLYRNDFDDKELIKISLQQDRILLTRDILLAKSKILKKVLLIKSEELKEQIREVLQRIENLRDFIDLMPRCPICNGETEYVEKSNIDTEIPDYVAMSNSYFIRCKRCGKIYWHGSHKERINRTKAEILRGLISAGKIGRKDFEENY